MGLANKITSCYQDGIDDITRKWFDPQLRRIGLSGDQIDQQDLAELEISLQKINDAIVNPDSFGKLRLEARVQSGHLTTIISDGTSYHVEVGILPLLLERKGKILGRIRALRPEQQLNEIKDDIAASVNDPEERERLIEIVDRRLREQQESSEKLVQEQARVEVARTEAQEREQRLKIEIRERKSAIYRSFLERESVASIVGAILLLALGGTLIVAMFVHATVSEIISSAFLLILGYFFGQSTMRDRDKN